MKRLIGVLAPLTLLIGFTAHADDATSGASPVRIQPLVGAYVPTGSQKDDLKTGVVAGAQFGYRLKQPVQLVGTFGWSPSEAKDLADTKTNIYQYDAGVEYAPVRSSGTAKIGPFVGAGVGGRTYSVENSSSSETGVDGFGAIGGQWLASRMGARVELRDYLSKFKGVEGNQASETRNDLMLTGAVTVRL